MFEAGTEGSLDQVYATPETNAMRERVIVCPCDGRFSPLPPQVFTSEGEWVEPGQVLANVSQGATAIPVVSQFRGWLMGMLALEGQPVHKGEALFWLWSH